MVEFAIKNDFVAFVIEQMQSIGPVTPKRMFSGHGVFLDGLMLALIVDQVLYLKTDTETVGIFEEKGLAPFTYVRNGKKCSLSYYQAPDDILDDSEKMFAWANDAYKAAIRAVSQKAKKKK